MAKLKNPSEGDSGSMTGFGKNFFAQPGNKPTKGKPPTFTTGGVTTGTYGKVEVETAGTKPIPMKPNVPTPKKNLKTPNPPKDKSTSGGKVNVNQYGKPGTSKNK